MIKQRSAHWHIYWTSMAGFLRKKVRQDPQTKPLPQSPPPSAPTSAPPLFARFASTYAVQEAPRIVSSPMTLASTRRDAAAPSLYQNRGARTVAQAAVQPQRDMDSRMLRHQSYTAGKDRDIPHEQGIRPPAPRQHSPTQLRARPTSHVPMLDKPLPPPSGLDPSNFGAPTAVSYQSRPLSVEFSSPIQGEYAHLWSMIAGEDTQPEPTSTKPIAAPEKVPVQKTFNFNQATTSLPTTSSHDVVAPIPHLIPQAGPSGLPSPPPDSQQSTFPIASSFGHDPDHGLPSHTLTSQPSNQSLSYQGYLTEGTASHSGAGASSSRTTLFSDNTQHDGRPDDVFGSRPLPSHRQSPGTSDFSPNQGFSSPSTSPKTDRKISKAKPPGQPSPAPPSRTSAVFEENRASIAQSQSSRDENHKSYHQPNPDFMGINFSEPDISAQQSFGNIPSQDILASSQRRIISPPPNAYTSQQQRTGMPNTSTPLRNSASVRSTKGPIITGKPLIFTAMAAVDQNGPQAPPHPYPAAHLASQHKTRSHPAPPPRQQYPSPPAEVYPHSRKSEPPLQQPLHSRPLPAAAHNNYGPAGGYPSPRSTHQPQPQPPPKDIQTFQVNGNFSPLPAIEQTVPTRQTPPRTQRPSKSRAPQSSADFSTYSHTSNNSVSYQRSPAKGRPVTPISPGQAQTQTQTQARPIQVDGDVLGVPLDDDPFANFEGVKMVGPVSTSRAPSPSPADGTGSRHKLSGGEEVFSDGVSYTELASQLPANFNAPPSPVSVERMVPEHMRGRVRAGEMEPEPQTVAPPIIDGVDGSEDRITPFMSEPMLLAALLGFLSFHDWCMILSLSREIRFMIVQNPMLREMVLERFLKTDLNDYMRGVSTPTHEYARVAALYVHSLSIHPSHRDQSLNETVHQLAASTRAYTRVVLRLRAQAEKEAAVARSRGAMRNGSRQSSRAPSPTYSQSNHGRMTPQSQQQAGRQTTSFQSPLFRIKRAPLLRVFVPSPDGDWLSDKSVLECEAECRRAGVMGLMRTGDVVWDVAVGDEGNVGRLVWDGSYLIDLDYTYSPIGDLPKYMPTLAFPPSYFHRVIRTGPNSSNPVVHIDLRPWGEEIATNLQLLQDRVRTETPQGAIHNVVRWVHRSSFLIRPPVRGSRSPSHYAHNRAGPQPNYPARIPIPESNNMFVDPGWYGTIVVETEGTNESLADLQDRCGPGAFPPRPPQVNGRRPSAVDREGKLVFRILREKSRPGEIWIRAVSSKERLL
ncbi:hypothetical protein D9615_010450 [Tricholomella constricta]|uniref:Uncharacterized protein n=1 Tax=Tricholomella constricta TaxID=117010 RepID=A0A8H5GLR4_9AGAR|nr:hypothetical protein D9615_010450 [Tricholomella constricta]